MALGDSQAGTLATASNLVTVNDGDNSILPVQPLRPNPNLQEQQSSFMDSVKNMIDTMTATMASMQQHRHHQQSGPFMPAGPSSPGGFLESPPSPPPSQLGDHGQAASANFARTLGETSQSSGAQNAGNVSKPILFPEIKDKMKAMSKIVCKHVGDLRKAKARLLRGQADESDLGNHKYPANVKEYIMGLDREFDDPLEAAKEDDYEFKIKIPKGKTRREAATFVHARCYQILKGIDVEATKDRVNDLVQRTKLDHFQQQALQIQVASTILSEDGLVDPLAKHSDDGSLVLEYAAKLYSEVIKQAEKVAKSVKERETAKLESKAKAEKDATESPPIQKLVTFVEKLVERAGGSNGAPDAAPMSDAAVPEKETAARDFVQALTQHIKVPKNGKSPPEMGGQNSVAASQQKARAKAKAKAKPVAKKQSPMQTQPENHGQPAKGKGKSKGKQGKGKGQDYQASPGKGKGKHEAKGGKHGKKQKGHGKGKSPQV